MSQLWVECISRVHRHLDKPLKANGRTDKDLEILRKKIDQDWLEKKHRMVFLIRAIWAQTPAKENQPVEPQSKRLHPPEVSQADSSTSVPYPLVVYHDKDEWRNHNEALWDSYTPEMKLMMTVEGYDMIEDLDTISVRKG
ncbi:hypothetical protein CPB86DRAFT_412357 [Serendipita vermifera]|nr:hypothetical protein CPB86DRAFT_412357 [Serendipita vermifera]